MKRDIISKIADRAVAMYGCRKIDIVMDLCCCIEGGCDLDLEKLLSADDFNFSHDICGIHTHLNHAFDFVREYLHEQCGYKDNWLVKLFWRD